MRWGPHIHQQGVTEHDTLVYLMFKVFSLALDRKLSCLYVDSELLETNPASVAD